jgi:hypothetical protein
VEAAAAQSTDIPTIRAPKNTKPDTIFNLKPTFTKVYREVIVETTDSLPPDALPECILQVVNWTQPENLRYYLTRCTPKGNIILLTLPNVAAADVAKYLIDIVQTMTDLGIHAVQARANSQWNQFIVHNIPTHISTDMERGHHLTQDIQLHMPAITFTQNPHWLVPASRLAGKCACSMVFSLPAELISKILRINSLPLFNRV